MKTIQITKSEAAWILLCKGWILKKHPIKSDSEKCITFIDYINPYFTDIYGWSADEFNKDFLGCVFNVLFDIFMKIRECNSNNRDIKAIMSAMAVNEYGGDNNPIIRGILAIKSQISMTRVLDENKIPVYDLNQSMDLFNKN